MIWGIVIALGASWLALAAILTVGIGRAVRIADVREAARIIGDEAHDTDTVRDAKARHLALVS